MCKLMDSGPLFPMILFSAAIWGSHSDEKGDRGFVKVSEEKGLRMNKKSITGALFVLLIASWLKKRN